MRTFNSFDEFSWYFQHTVVPEVRRSCENSLEPMGEEVRKQAFDQIGHYQNPIGSFGAWAPLAPATIERKEKLGLGLSGDPDSPLYATGEFRNDISSSVDRATLQFRTGTSKRYIVYTELGTAEMPPRSVFGPAGLRSMPANMQIIKQYIANGFRATLS